MLREHPDLRPELARFLEDDRDWNRLAGALHGSARGEADDGANPTEPKEIGPYVVLDEIARGGMGVVYRARHKHLGRVVALKRILGGAIASEEDVQRFRREMRAVASVDHRHIVPIYEVGEHEGCPTSR